MQSLLYQSVGNYPSSYLILEVYKIIFIRSMIKLVC